MPISYTNPYKKGGPPIGVGPVKMDGEQPEDPLRDFRLVRKPAGKAGATKKKRKR